MTLVIVNITRDKDLLAEITGIHFGDDGLGSYNYTYKLSVSCNSKENYWKYVQKIYFSGLGVNMRINSDKSKNSIILYYNSKEMYNFLIDKLQFPTSPKRNLRIPKWIYANTLRKQGFLKGLFDTDGCITLQKDGKYQYQLLKYTTRHFKFAQEIQQLLDSLQIRSYICTKNKKRTVFDVVIRRKESVKTFFETIQPEKRKAGDAAIRTRICR